MVVLIKNNVASVEGVAHLSLSPAGGVAERCTPSLRDAGVPRAKSLPQRSSNPTDSVSPPSVSSPQPSSDEESPRESDNFSFYFDQYEEWTEEVEARMQNEIDRMLEDARRLLAEPVINISELFPDDLLADSSRSGPSSLQEYDGSCSGDEEDEAEEDGGFGMDNVWEDEETAYVPARPLTPIPEESLADEFIVGEDAHSPPLSCETISVHERRRWVADLEEGLKVEITTKSSAEPPIPPRPPDVYLRRRRRRWKPPDSYR